MRFPIAILSMLAAVSIAAQTITPVESDDEKPQEPTLHYYDKHGNPLKEPVLFLSELDTVKASPKAVYPLLNSVQIGVNFFDAITLLAKSRHASFDMWANISLYNWFFPTIEAGMGYGTNRPEEAKYTYRTLPSFYLKAGLDYNFFYKSDPGYRLFLGVRAGVSNFRYEHEIATPGGSGERIPAMRESVYVDSRTATSCFGEALVGISVKLWKGLSAGWSARYRLRFKTWNGDQNYPFVPGYGGGSPLGFTLSLSYTIPLAKTPAPAPGTDSD